MDCGATRWNGSFSLGEKICKYFAASSRSFWLIVTYHEMSGVTDERRDLSDIAKFNNPHRIGSPLIRTQSNFFYWKWWCEGIKCSFEILNSYSCRIARNILLLWFICNPKIYATDFENSPKGVLSLTKKYSLSYFLQFWCYVGNIWRFVRWYSLGLVRDSYLLQYYFLDCHIWNLGFNIQLGF